MQNKRSVWYDKLTDTPILNPLYIAASELGVLAIAFNMDEATFLEMTRKRSDRYPLHEPDKIAAAASQLREYLWRERTTFTLPFDLSLATKFQAQVLLAVYTVPFGQVRSYGDIASQIGHPRAARAVGQANSRNPLPIVIPCHRVIGRGGKLCGYLTHKGEEIQRQLLQLEGALPMTG